MFLSEIIYILGCEYFIKDKRIKEIKIDSRNLNKGDLFICINNGHNYIEEAVRKKVSAIIVDRDIEYDIDIPIIKVDNTIKALGIISSYIRNKYNGIVIAITGSNGKTTTKELLSFILNNYGKVLKNIGTENNHIGIPKALLKLNNSYNYVVLELGTNHIGEIEYLTNIVKPDYAIITNIGTSHIGNFGSIDNILKEKLSIKSENTTLIINGENEYLKDIEGIRVYNDSYDYIPSIDLYKMNYYLVFKLLEYLNFNLNEVYESLKGFKNINSRMEKYIVNNITLIDDSYNASYESVIGGLNSLDKDSRKIIVLGDMLELGEYSKELHIKVGEFINNMNNTILITIGNETKYINNDIHFNDLEVLKEYLELFDFVDNDIIYLKGSNKIGLYKLVPSIKNVLQK